MGEGWDLWTVILSWDFKAGSGNSRSEDLFISPIVYISAIKCGKFKAKHRPMQIPYNTRHTITDAIHALSIQDSHLVYLLFLWRRPHLYLLKDSLIQEQHTATLHACPQKAGTHAAEPSGEPFSLVYQFEAGQDGRGVEVD
jgi:hypothetical protein